jgi:predicted transcriptional regulator
MNLTSREIIKNLNERLFTQSAVIETLCELLISKEVVTHDELENLIYNNIETRKDELKELTEKLKSKPTKIQITVEDEFNNTFDEGLMEGMYFGPIGEC